MLQVQSWRQVSNNTGILNTCTRLSLTESDQVTPADSIKDVVRSSVKVPEFDKHLKKAGRHIGRNFVEITIKMKTIVWKPFMIIILIGKKIFITFLENGFLKLICFLLLWIYRNESKVGPRAFCYSKIKTSLMALVVQCLLEKEMSDSSSNSRRIISL